MTEDFDFKPEALRIWRTKRGYSIAHSARKIGVPTSTWSRWESGKTIPSAEHKARIKFLLEAGDTWGDNVSQETLKAIRMIGGIPFAGLLVDGLLTLFDGGPKRENKFLAYVRTWFEDNFVRRQPKKLTADENDIFRQTSFFALNSGYSVATLKYAENNAEIKKWGHASDWLFMDLSGLQSEIKDDLWFEAFDLNFVTGYALRITEFYDRLGEDTHGFAPMPHDFACERAVLGCALMKPSMLAQIVDTLSENDFFVETHRLIFQTIRALYSNGKPVTSVSVTAEMRNQGTLESIGGPGQLQELAFDVPDLEKIMNWIKLIKTKSRQRKLIKAAKRVVKECYSEVGPTDSSLGQLEKTIKDFKSTKSEPPESASDPEA